MRHGSSTFGARAASAGDGGGAQWAEAARHGRAGRNRIQLRLLEVDEMADVIAGLAFLRGLPGVDPHRVGAVGHSFGGSLTLLLAERGPGLGAAVAFGGAAGSWEVSPALRQRMLAAVRASRAPIFLIQAANDYSVAPAVELGKEMQKFGKPHRVKIYPAAGATADDGHRFVYLQVATWEPDVFAFLDEYLKR